MKRTPIVSAALFVCATVLPAAAQEGTKPPTSPSAAAQAAPAASAAAKTPFRVLVDGNTVFVANYGAEDWKGPVNVIVSCVPVAPTTSCGPDFPGGSFRAPYPAFPPGHGVAPVKSTGQTQDPWGPGWVAVYMGLPTGSYRVTATAGSNSSSDTAVTIGPPHAAATKANPASPAAKPKPHPVKVSPPKTS